MNPQQEGVITRAVELFGRYGVKLVTMDDVAAACGLSKKTIYQLFQNKDDLIQTAVAKLALDYTQAYQAIRNKQRSVLEEVLDSVGIIEKAFCQLSPRMLAGLHKYHYNSWLKIMALREGVLLDFIKSNLRRGQDEGCYHRRFDNDIIAAMRLRELVALYESLPEPIDPAALHHTLTQIARHYLAGLVTPEAAALLE